MFNTFVSQCVFASLNLRPPSFDKACRTGHTADRVTVDLERAVSSEVKSGTDNPTDNGETIATEMSEYRWHLYHQRSWLMK